MTKELRLHEYQIRWLLREVVTDEIIGITTFVYRDLDFNDMFDKLDDILEMKWREWDWSDVTKAEYETYQAFGFKEYTL